MFYYIVSDTYKRMCTAYVTKEPCCKLNTCEPATQPENQPPGVLLYPAPTSLTGTIILNFVLFFLLIS